LILLYLIVHCSGRPLPLPSNVSRSKNNKRWWRFPPCGGEGHSEAGPNHPDLHQRCASSATAVPNIRSIG